MTRTWCALLLVAAAAGCDQPAGAPSPAANVAAPAPAATGQSIMQPRVIAEVEPTPTPSPTPAPPPPTGITIAFPQGTALDAAGRQALDAFLAAPGVPADATLVLRGSSDSMGSDAANLVSSRRRAGAVRDHLIARGIDADRISVVALGERRPVAPNAALDGSDDPAGRARNRRVDVEVVPAPPPPTPAPAAD